MVHRRPAAETPLLLNRAVVTSLDDRSCLDGGSRCHRLADVGHHHLGVDQPGDHRLQRVR